VTQGSPQLANFVKTTVCHGGNCLFICISLAIDGIQGNFNEIKELINDFVFKNWDYFQNIALD